MARRAVTIVLGLALIAALVVVLGFAALLMLGSSSVDTRTAFPSPSSARTLHLIETCRANACTHQAVVSMPAPGGGTVEIRCGLDIAADRPVFDRVEVDWLNDESGVMIRYGLTQTAMPSYALDFIRDCNA